MFQAFIQLTVLQFSNIGSSDHLSIFVQQTSLLGNGTSGRGMVARNHDHADSRIAAAIYGCTYRGAQRIANPHEAKRHQSSRSVERSIRQTLGNHKYTQTALSEMPGAGKQLLLASLV